MPENNLFEEVKEAYDIVEVVANYVKLKKVGRNYVGLCPFHSEKTPSFVVSPEKQIFKCFGCGVAGDVVTFYMKIKGLSFKEALLELAEQAGIRVDYREFKTRKEDKGLVELNYRVAKFYHHLLKVHGESQKVRDYLKKRGISEETVEKFMLGFAPAEGRVLASYLRSASEDLEKAVQAGLLKKSSDGSFIDLFRDRLIFPVTNLRGEFVGFGGRALEKDQEPKYLNTPETKIYKKSEVLYGLYHSKEFIKKYDKGFVVEGYFDFLSLWNAGVKNVVATCGTALTEKHVKTLKKFTENWVILYDGDSAGKKASIRAISLFLKEGISPECVCLPEEHDPDSWIRETGLKEEALLEALSSLSKPGVEFILDYYKDAYLKSPSRTFKEVVELFKGIEDPILKQRVVKELSFFFDLPEHEILKAISGKGTSKLEVRDEELEKDSFEELKDQGAIRLIAQYLLSYPEDYAGLKAAGLLEFLQEAGESRYVKFLQYLVKELEKGKSNFEYIPDPDFQEILGDLMLSPEFEDREEVFEQIKAYLFRHSLRQRLKKLVESVRSLEKQGAKEEVEKYLWMLKDTITTKPIKSKEEPR